MPMPLKLLLVDDHTMVREGLMRVLERGGTDWWVRGAANGFEALALLRETPADIAIVDLTMPGMSGLDLIGRIHADFPQVKVLVLSMHAEEQYAMRAFKAGAMGYLTKDRAASELVGAIRKVAAGSAFVSEMMAELAVRQLHGDKPQHHLNRLSNRELEVFKRIATGERLTDVARALHLSIKTVSTHKSRAQQKLGLPSTAALIRYGLEQGLAPGSGETVPGGLGMEPAP